MFAQAINRALLWEDGLPDAAHAVVFAVLALVAACVVYGPIVAVIWLAVRS